MSYKASQYGAYLDGSGLSISGTLPAEGTVFTTFTVASDSNPSGTLFRFADHTISLESTAGQTQFAVVITNDNGEQNRFNLNTGEQYTVGSSFDATDGGGAFLFTVEGINNPWGDHSQYGFTPSGSGALEGPIFSGVSGVWISEFGYGSQTFGSPYSLGEALKDPDAGLTGATRLVFSDLTAATSVTGSDSSSTISVTGGSLSSSSLVPEIGLVDSGSTVTLYEDSSDGSSQYAVNVSLTPGVLSSDGSDKFALKIAGNDGAPHTLNISSMFGNQSTLEDVGFGGWASPVSAVEGGGYTYVLIQDSIPDFLQSDGHSDRYVLTRVDSNGDFDKTFDRDFYSDFSDAHITVSPDGLYVAYWDGYSETDGILTIENTSTGATIQWAPPASASSDPVDYMVTNSGQILALYNSTSGTSQSEIRTFDPFGVDPTTPLSTSAPFSTVSEFTGRQADGLMALTSDNHLVFSSSQYPSGSTDSYIVVDLTTGNVSSPVLPTSITSNLTSSGTPRISESGAILVPDDMNNLVQYNLVTEASSTVLSSDAMGSSNYISVSADAFYLATYPTAADGTTGTGATGTTSTELVTLTKYNVPNGVAVVDTAFGDSGNALVSSDQVPSSTMGMSSQLFINGELYSGSFSGGSQDIHQDYDSTYAGSSYSFGGYTDWDGNSYVSVYVYDSSVTNISVPLRAGRDGDADEAALESFAVSLVSGDAFVVDESRASLSIDVMNDPDADWNTDRVLDPGFVIMDQDDGPGVAFEAEGGAFKYQQSSYWGDPDGDGTYEDVAALYHSPQRYYDLVVEDGVSVDKAVINVDLSHVASGLKYDLVSNWDSIWFDYNGNPIDITGMDSWMQPSPYVDGSLGSSAAWDEFRIDLSAVPTGLNFYATFDDYASGAHTEFLTEWTVTNTTNGVDIEIAGVNGALSSTQLDSVLSEIGFDYQSVTNAQAVTHTDIIYTDFDLFKDNVELTANIGPQDEGQFRFGNYAPEIFDASYNGHLVELMYHGPGMSTVNDWWGTELLEGLSEDEWSGWMGWPDPALFTVTDSAGASYDVQVVIPEQSALLVLDRAVTAGETLTIVYDDPAGDQIQYVAQSEMGVDAPDQTINASAASYQATFDVLDGATLGWDNWLEERFYVGDQNWDETAGSIVSVAADGRGQMEITPLPWRKNDHFEAGATGFEGYEYVRLRLELTVDSPSQTMTVGDLPLYSIVDTSNDYLLHQWKWVVEGANDPSPGTADASFELAQWSVPNGYPGAAVAVSEFGFFTGTITGGDYGDNLDFALNAGSVTINAGSGDDKLGGSVFFSDTLDGGDGTDIVLVNGRQADYDVVETAPGLGVFEISLKSSVTDTFVDQGTTDTLINVEGIQFDDGYKALTLDGMSNAVEITSFTIDQIGNTDESATVRLSLDVSADVREALRKNPELDDVDFFFRQADGTTVEYAFYRAFVTENSTTGAFELELEVPRNYLADGAIASIDEIRVEETQKELNIQNPSVTASVDYAAVSSQAPTLSISDYIFTTLNGEEVIQINGSVSDADSSDFHVFFDIGIESNTVPGARDWIHADLDASAINTDGTFTAYIDRHYEHWKLDDDYLYIPDGDGFTFRHVSAVAIDDTGSSASWDHAGNNAWLYVSESNDVAFSADSVPDLSELFRVDDKWGSWIVEFEHLPDALLKNGFVTINLDQDESFDFWDYDGPVLPANTADFWFLPSDPANEQIGLPSILTSTDDVREISYRGSSADEVVYFGDDTVWGDAANWSAGRDHFIFADDDRGNAVYFENYTRELLQDGVDLANLQGVNVTLTNGDMTMNTSYGTVTGDGVYKISDTSSSDRFTGSSSDESFRFQYGGTDTVTGGGGSDRFRLEYRETTWATGDQPSLPYSVHITDYSTDDVIRFEEMGFDAAIFKKQIETVYDAQDDVTRISVVTDAVDRGHVEAVVNGKWIIGQADLNTYSNPSREAYAEVRLVSADIETMLAEIVELNFNPGYYLDTHTRVHLDAIPETLLASGISIDTSQNLATLDGASYAFPEYVATSDYTYYDTTQAKDTIIDDSIAVGFGWSAGNDNFTADSNALFAFFSGGAYGKEFDASRLGSETGLTFDMSGGDLVVASALGTIQAFNVREVFDTPFSDTVIGSDGADFFKTRFGGYDVVTGGDGADQFEVQYYTARAADRESGNSQWYKELQGMEITDYESGEIIELQAMDFDTQSYANEVYAYYDQPNDFTVIGVTNGAGNVDQDFIFVRGQFELNTDSLVYVEVGNNATPSDTLRLSLSEVGGQKITTTDLTGVTVGDLVEPTTSEFDYFDLTDLTGEWVIDVAFGGIGTEGTDVGTVWYWDSADYYDFRGFEGYIIAGNTDGTYAEYLGATGTDEIVVVEGGSDLFVDLGLDSIADVLSFRGTNDGVTIDLSASNNFGITNFNLASSVDPNGEVRGADYLFGSEAGDDFTGYSDASNILAGYGGADTLTGGGLSDVLIGGTGNDLLSGLAGNDVLIDLDDGTLTGGDGNDLFVVRGTNNTGTNTEVADFELGANGPGLGGGNKSYADRIAFNFSVSALASTSLSAAEGGLLSNLNYETLENLISIDITEGTDPSKDFTITATLSAASQTDTNAVDITLGTLDVVLDPNTTLDTTKERLEYRIEDQEDFLASIKSTVLDQMLYNQSALSVTGTQTDTSQMLDDTVNLFISLVREDKFAVPGGQGKPVLVALRDANGNDLGTNFRPGQGNEVIAAGRADDKITIQQDPEMSISDTYGRDTVVERGGDNDQIIMPLSLQDLLDTDDLDLSRVQRGREGEGKTLQIKYHDSTQDADSINDVDLMVYKQYNDYSTSFRVENLTLYNDDGTNTNTYVEVNYDLGTVTATGLETTAEDAILVGRLGIADEMVVKFNAGEAGLDQILDIVLADVTAKDTVSIEGYGSVTSVADGTHRYDSDNDITTDHQVVTTDTGYTINLYFTDYSPTNDEWLINTVAV